MAESREERMQQRLRGAQRRQVKDFDFGFGFPAGPAQVESEPPLPGQTPGSRGRDQPARATPGESNVRNDANTSAKRKKLDGEGASTPFSSSRNTRSSVPPSSSDIYALPEDEPDDEAEADRATSQVVGEGADLTDVRHLEELPTASEEVVNAVEATEQEGTPTLQPIGEQEGELDVILESGVIMSTPRLGGHTTPFLRAQVEEEIIESPKNAPGSGSRVRIRLNRAAVQGSQLHEAIQDNAAAIEDVQSLTKQKKRQRSDTDSQQSGRSTKRTRRSLDIEMNGIPNKVEAVSLQHVARRGQKLKSSTVMRNSMIATEEPKINLVEEAEEINDEEAATILKQNRSRRVSRNAGSPDLDVVTSTTTPPLPKKKRTKSYQASSPVRQRHPKNHRSSAKVASSPGPSKKQRKQSNARRDSPIPITVHRLTRRLYYEEDEADANILNAEIPHVKRSGVNAVDVLSQICEEVVDSGIETLRGLTVSAEDFDLRREYMTKSKGIEAFGKELETRLIEHTTNLDNTTALEKRVREEQRKKLALREKILRVRAEREQVALRMDEVRIKHEGESKATYERDFLNTTIHDVELAVEQGMVNQVMINEPVRKTGIELLLKRIATEVSNKGDSGGFLAHIKNFNDFLERAAIALETRKV
ncbi:hypothetical protein B0O99DRAFT_592212 [Bisporella sp. PMI_857]|nr:hypothetical protein B0O99DRAFT_592212 [Bisporella sp. PMI_857]